VVYPVCCGIDVHQAQLTTCLRQVDGRGHVSQVVREFGTTTSALLALLEWLVEQHCPVVALESTGVYWKPVYHVLVGTVEGHCQFNEKSLTDAFLVRKADEVQGAKIG
jgi:transposase